jgi:glycosyltransferase involved in cell wall biosynthesis
VEMLGDHPQHLFRFAAAAAVAALDGTRSVDGCICCQHASAFGLRRAGVRLGIPFVLVSHGDIFDHPKDAFSLPMMHLYSHAARFAYRTARHVICVGRALRERAIICGARPESVTVIPNGVDATEISGLDHPNARRESNWEILYVGRVSPEKGVEVLVRAMAEVGDLTSRLRIVGTGSDLVRLQALTAELGLQPRIRFVGAVPRKALAAFYATADVVVLPSLADAQPVVSLEAQLAGVPVIGSNVGGIPDVVQHGVNGVLVPAGRPRELAEAIRTLATDPGRLAAMAANARQNARCYTWPSMLEAFEKTVEAALATAQGRSAGRGETLGPR